MPEPLWRRRFGDPTWDGILRGTGAIGVAAIGFILWLPGTTALVIFVLLALACHGPLSPFLPATFEPILLFYGRFYPPPAVALLGALASAAAEYLNYHLYRALLRCESLDRVMQSGTARAIRATFGRRPFLAIWVCAATPVPDWAARILASHAHYPVGRYLLAFIAGRVPLFWLLATVGLHWMPSGATLLLVVGASLVLTALSLRQRAGPRLPTPRTEPTSVAPTARALI